MNYDIFFRESNQYFNALSKWRPSCKNFPALRDDRSNEGETSEDQHSFVALIDILFTDGAKRTCTGTIIHDNVIITAAHCFKSEMHSNARPELTASFVVIGTKHLFETGYEQYLPIERVLTHPKFKDWSADIALVYTFAGMTSDKPGAVISLAGERTSTPVDANVTVLSWGDLKDNKENHHGVTKMKKTHSNKPCSDSTSQEKSEEITENSTSAASLRAIPKNTANDKIKLQKTEQQYVYNVQKHEMSTTKTNNKRNLILRTNRNHGAKKILEPNWPRSSEEYEMETYNIKSFYKDWRRQMGTQQNKLNVDTYGFVNMHTCKRFLENAVPDKIQLEDTNDVVCYSAEGHYVTHKDSGAPVIHQGRLVAVTVGGIEKDGEHVAIGMKINCYCSWIFDNLPFDRSNVSCCKNCCDIKHEDNNKMYKLKTEYI